MRCVPDIHCFTSANLAYLDRARVLGESLRRHQPGWRFTLCLTDALPEGFTLDLAAEPFDDVVRLEELDIPEPRRWAFGHDIVELSTAVKGPMLCRLLGTGAKVVYLDPDIALFAPLDDLPGLLDRHDLLVTPHMLAPEDRGPPGPINEFNTLRHGVFNLGFLAVRPSPDGLRFAQWWRDRLLDHCLDDAGNHPFTDQEWVDLAPGFFPGLHILRDPGLNVACWNLSRRPVTIGGDGAIRAGGVPLRFFHFTQIQRAVGEEAIAAFAGDDTAVFELVAWYRRRLAAHAATGLPEGWWAYGCYADGRPIPRAHRRAWRASAELRARFADPFAAGPGSLAEHLLAQSPG